MAARGRCREPADRPPYTDSVRWLCTFLVEHDMLADTEGVDAPHISAYLRREEQQGAYRQEGSRSSGQPMVLTFRDVTPVY